MLFYRTCRPLKAGCAPTSKPTGVGGAINGFNLVSENQSSQGPSVSRQQEERALGSADDHCHRECALTGRGGAVREECAGRAGSMSLSPLRSPSITLQAGPQATHAGSSTSDSWPDLHHLHVLQPNAALKQIQKRGHQEVRDRSPNQAGRRQAPSGPGMERGPTTRDVGQSCRESPRVTVNPGP